MKHKKILFVCAGDTCRSPMAEAAFRAELKRRKIAWYTVSSAGVSARGGTPMNPDAKQALTEAGIPFSETFKSRRLDTKTVEEAFAVICMTEDLRAAIGRDSVTTFFGLAGREIPDPYGQGIDAYRVTLRMIRECIPKIIKQLGMDEKNQGGNS